MTPFTANCRPAIEALFMPIDPKLSDLLLTWEEARARGEELRPEELCRDCPDLTPLLAERIDALKSFATVLDLSAYSEDAAAAAAPPEDAVGSLPGYTLLGEIGRGGAGVVYKARQTALNRLVAVKMVLAGQYAGEAALARFRSEAQTLARLRHPHIVQVYDVATYHGAPYFVLEYLDGNLAEFLAGEPLTAEESARLVELLAHTMHQAHQQGIIHRDLKPANVLLEKIPVSEVPTQVEGEKWQPQAPSGALYLRGQWLRPKIGDFGLARPVGAGLDVSGGAVVGTPGYMAPEQIQGQRHKLGPATDVYGLGVLLYQLLTATLPFAGETLTYITQAVTVKEPEPPSRRRRDCPAALEAICLRCLRKDPARRYATAEALANDLRRFLEGKPTAARPRRHWWPAAAVAAILLGAVGVWAWTVGFGFAPPGGQLAPAPTNQKQPPAPGAAPAIVKIGVLVPPAGPHAVDGEALAAGVEAAAEELNERGANLQVLVRRAAEAPEALAALAERLCTEEHVDVLIGGWTPEECAALLPIAEKHKKLLLAPAPALDRPNAINLVTLAPRSAAVAEAVAAWVKSWWGRREVHPELRVVGDDDPWSAAAAAQVREALAATLGRPLEELVPATRYHKLRAYWPMEYEPLAISIKAHQGPRQVVLDFVSGGVRPAVLQAYRAWPVDPARTTLVFAAVTATQAYTVERMIFRGCYLVCPVVPGTDVRAGATFLAHWQARFPTRFPGPSAVSGYCAMHLWFQALKGAGDRAVGSRAALVAAGNFNGPNGPVSVGGPDDSLQQPLWVSELTRRGFQARFSWPATVPADAPGQAAPQ
jgi:ABC-type branched-subunit amino acid transport system substrate-binding protein